MPESIEAIAAMPWRDLQALFAVQFADDITSVTTGQSEAVISQRLSRLGEHGRSLLREALDEIETAADNRDTRPRGDR